ncbi:MAG: signal peptide peptidase SppA [Bacteroides sp.]|nr:signal peptide peptidase SppA [Bacteroides sp.]
MKSFFKYLLASVVGMLIVCLVMFFVFVGSLGAMFAGSSKPAVLVKDNSVLELCLDKTVSDRSHSESSNMGVFSMPGLSKTMGLNGMLRALAAAKDDARIKGLYIKYDGGSVNWATATELRAALQEFKDAGKFIYAYADGYPQSAYYLASVADSVFMQPQGSVAWQGMGAQLMFFADFFKKVGIEMQIVRHGQFKSAVEPYFRNDMSAANRLQYSVLFNSMWNKVLADVASSRNLSVVRLNEIADRLDGFTANGSLKSGLVDALVPVSMVEENLLSLRSGLADSVKVERIALADYAKTVKAVKAQDKIAVVYAEGEIVGGEGSSDNIGTDLAEQIKKAVKDKNVKALVLRVNSPGGSVLTSDIIYQELMKVRERMPVVASYGNYAASGGYYISCMAHKIYAQPTTLTGSIGVFGVIPNLKGVTDKIGIHIDEVGTNRNASALRSVFRPMNAYETAVMQQSIEEVYAGFIGKVAQGRGMTTAQVDSIGQGRVWSGANAIEIGLVDELGGLQDAVAGAAELAQLGDYSLVEYPKEKSLSEQIFELLGDMEARSAKAYITKHFGKTGMDAYAYISELLGMDEPQVLARMPEVLVFE